MGRAKEQVVVGKVLLTGIQAGCCRYLGGWAGTSLRWQNLEAGVGQVD